MAERFVAEEKREASGERAGADDKTGREPGRGSLGRQFYYAYSGSASAANPFG